MPCRYMLQLMGSKESVRLSPDLRQHWKATASGTADGLPVPLGRLAELGLEAHAGGAVAVRDDAVSVIARQVWAGLAEAGLLEGRGAEGLTTAYLPGDVRERWKASGLALPALVGLGLEAWYAGRMVPRPADAVDVIARLIRDGLVEAGLLDS